MKKFIQRVQDLGQKAAHLKQVVEAAPEQAAQLRDTVLMTAGQLQQMRHDVQSSVMGLKADNEARLAQALKEINDHAEVFQEAGYELTGVDMELSPTQRLIVHLERRDNVSEAVLRSLLSANSGRQTLYALINALAKAESIHERVNLSHLTYRELVVHVGPTPSVRLCWQKDAPEQNFPPTPGVSIPATPTPIATTLVPPPLPAFGAGSFFEQRPVAAPSAARETPVATVEPSPVPITPPAPASRELVDRSAGGDWKASSLDRFKKMPDVSKYRR